MALNLYTENPTAGTVNMSNLSDTYFINAVSGTYTYNLPTISSDGQHFRLNRVDNTTSTVNLVGNISSSGTIFASYPIGSYISLEVVSLNSIWYVIEENSIVSIGLNNIISAMYINNNGSGYITYTTGNIVLSFPFKGTSTGSSISAVLINMKENGSPTLSTSINFNLNDGPTGSTLVSMSNGSIATNYYIYIFTDANKAVLPASTTYLSVVYSPTSSVSAYLTSIVFYS